MDTLEIPFVAHIGIEQSDEESLSLKNVETVHNHIGTMHAAALFTLAETQSGLYLQKQFPELSQDALPLLRSSTVKYKNPVTGIVYSRAYVSDEALEKFETQFHKRGRASIVLDMELIDNNEKIVMTGEFGWFVQKHG